MAAGGRGPAPQGPQRGACRRIPSERGEALGGEPTGSAAGVRERGVRPGGGGGPAAGSDHAEGGLCTAVRPRPTRAFRRRVRAHQGWCILAPRAGDDIALVHNPRTGEPFSVPALILPDERDLALVCRLTGDSTR